VHRAFAVCVCGRSGPLEKRPRRRCSGARFSQKRYTDADRARPADESELLSPSRGAAGEAAAAATAAALEGRAAGGGAPATWDAVCEWVLGRRVSLWDAVFEAAFLQVRLFTK
jgi:hypothetical protein